MSLDLKKTGIEELVATEAIDQPTPMNAASIRSIEQKFIRLRDEWKAHRGHHSDTLSLVTHPAYQQIIGMGHEAVPFLLRELAIAPDRWYWALRAITCEDPVPPEARGDSKAMAQAWLNWGTEQGYKLGYG